MLEHLLRDVLEHYLQDVFEPVTLHFLLKLLPGDIQARVTTGGKTSAIIMAEDKATGLLLRADIIIDRIDSLRIVTKTHELYLEETPEKFEVRAYDEHGNEFSSLEGIKFRWTIESGGGTGRGTDILRFMSWQDSPYNTVPILEKLESQGFQGNKVLLEGIKTGSAKVSVKLVDSQHSSVSPAVEPLMVNQFDIRELNVLENNITYHRWWPTCS